jgi:hypothetical protein
MENLEQILMPLIPWAMVGGFIFLMSNLTKQARKATKVAIAVGVFVQMFTPDPKVEQTIQLIVQQKQQSENQQGQAEGESNNYPDTGDNSDEK